MLNLFVLVYVLLASSRFANYLRYHPGEPRFATTLPPTSQDKLQGKRKNWKDITLCGCDSTLYTRGSAEVLRHHRLPYLFILNEFRRKQCLSQKMRSRTFVGGREHLATSSNASANSLASRYHDVFAAMLESTCRPYCKLKEIGDAFVKAYALNYWSKFAKNYEHIAFDTNKCTRLYGNSFCHTTMTTKSEETGPSGKCNFVWALPSLSAQCRKHRHGSAYDRHSVAYPRRRRQRSTATTSTTRQLETWCEITFGYFKEKTQPRAS